MAGIYGCFRGRNSSDSAAMASGPPDVTASPEPAEVVEECTGKKKSKFQSFKKFFARKKRKEPSVFGTEGGLKASQSSEDVNSEPENGTLTRSEKDNGSGSKVSLGSKALSHDSIFVSDSSEAQEALGASQDSIPGKVKSLQMQLKQAIRLGSPPSLMCVKKTEDAATMSEDDGLPCSPPEYSTHTVLNQVQTNSSLSLEGTDSDEDQRSSRAVSPLVAVPGDFSLPASPNVCLDNSAAKHKLGLRHKAHAKRKPASRTELRVEGNSLMDDTLSTSIAESVEERETDVNGEQLRTTAASEEEEHSRRPLLRDTEEDEGEEDELGAGPDVSHAPEDTSSALLSDGEKHLPEEEEAPDGQAPTSPSTSTTASRLTPEPPSCQREYLLDAPTASLAYGGGSAADEPRAERDDSSPLGLLSDGEDDDDGVLLGNIGGMESGQEEESSFLQEVLSSLKTPLTSCSLGLEAGSMALRVGEEDKQDSEEEEREEMEEEESEDALEALEAERDVEIEDDGVMEGEVEAAFPSSTLTPPPAQEQEVVSATPCQAVGEEEEEEEEDGTRDEEEKAWVGELSEDLDKEEEPEAPDVTPAGPNAREEDEPFTPGSDGAESHGEEEEKESEKEEKDGEEDEEEEELVEEVVERQHQEEAEERAAWEERDDEKESVEEEMVVEGDEAEEEEREEQTMETFPDQTMVETPAEARPVADEAPDNVDTAAVTEEPQTLLMAQPSPTEPECQDASDRISADEEEGGDDVSVEMERGMMEQKEDVDTEGRPDVEPTTGPQDVDRASVGTPPPDILSTPDEDQSNPEEELTDEPVATEQATVSSRPPSLSIPETHGYSGTEPQAESESPVPSTPGDDDDTVVATDPVSPSSQQAATPPAQQLTGEEIIDNTAAERDAVKRSSSGAGVEEEEDAAVSLGDNDEEEPAKLSPTEAETTEEAPQNSSPPTATTTEEEAVKPSSPTADQSKVRFTIAPAWQRSLSTGGGSPDEAVVAVPPGSPPSSPTACPSADPSSPQSTAEPVSSTKVEVVLSPTSKMRNVTAIPGKKQSSTNAATEESPAQGESPFGVRLRRTVVLHRFSSEEENTETPPSAVDPSAQPATNKAAPPPHPISAKPSLSQPITIKPALPRKPEVHGEKPKSTPDVTSPRGAPGGSDPPSWISVARQKQRIYKDGSLEETTLRKEEPERKCSLPLYISSAASRDHSKTPELTGKGSTLETTKSTTPVEREGRRAFSSPTPVPPQPAKPQPHHPAPIAPKPLSQHSTTSQRAPLSAPTPVPVSPRVSPCVSPPPPLTKTVPSTKTPQPQTSPTQASQRALAGQSSSPLTCPPFSNRSTLAQSGTVPPRAAGLSSPPTQPSQPQDEPPWMALAKKKAKAWSEMPQIVQ